MNDNLKKMLSLMLFMSDQQVLDDNVEKIVKKKNWFQKYTWTAKDQDRYADLFSNNLKKNWEGIVDKKPTTKKERDKITSEFILTYGLKTRPLTIKDFTQLIPFGQLDEKMTKEERKDFDKWMLGQTTSLHGVYRWDLERYLK